MAIRQRKKGIWQIEVDLGYDSKGKRKRINKTFHGGKKEAKAFEAKLKEQIKNGTIVDNKKSFEELTDFWFNGYAESNLKPKTRQEYKRLIKITNQHIGSYRLEKLKPIILMNFYSYLRQDRGLIESSVIKYYALINKILNDAVKWDLIPYKPNQKVERPKPVKKNAEYYNEKEVKELLTAISDEDPQTRALIYLTIDTGARRGEIAGLGWEDIDFNTNTVKITKTRQTVLGVGVIEKEPKNNSSIRQNILSRKTIEVLKELKEHEERQKELLGDKWLNGKKIFKNAEGDNIHPDRITHIFIDTIKKHNLKYLTFHGLRHTSISLMINDNAPILAVSKRVGHSSLATTLNIYSHAFTSKDSEIADRFNNILQ